MVAEAEASPGAGWLAPHAGMAMAEHFADAGRHVLLAIDDLTKHAAVHREIALLLGETPGREAYPADVFYAHARLLERAARLSKARGGGSITALPIAETQAGNLSAYLRAGITGDTANVEAPPLSLVLSVGARRRRARRDSGDRTELNPRGPSLYPRPPRQPRPRDPMADNIGARSRPMQETVSLLHRPLIRLAGGVITPGALMAGSAVVIATLLLSALAGRALRRVLARRGLSAGAQFAAAKIVRYVLVVVGIVVAIDSIGLNLSTVLAASTVLLVGIGFGLQNIAQNFISGLILLVEQPIRRGDFIKVGDAYGVVDDIGLRATRVITRDQVTIIVPNSELIGTQVINHSIPTSNLRVAISVGVAYGTDTALVTETLLAVPEAHPQILSDPKPEVRFEDFGDSSLDFSLLVWIAEPGEDRRIASALRFEIDRRFRQAGIEIPFPQRDLHLVDRRGMH